MAESKKKELEESTSCETGGDKEKINRRQALEKGAAFVAAAVAAGATAALPSVAQADDGDALLVGKDNFSTSRTHLYANVPENDSGLYVSCTQPFRTVIVGTGHFGVRGEGRLPGGLGISGHFYEPEGGGFGTAVRGIVFASNGKDPSEKGVGVWGLSGVLPLPGDMPSGTGVQGDGIQVGVGARSATGRALDVRGKACFSSSGSSVISCGSHTKTVSGVALDENALILVTLQGYAGCGVCVSYAQKITDTSFKVVLNKPASKQTPFAWFVIN